VVKPGGVVVYALLVRNVGVAAAVGVVLTDTLSEWTSAVLPASSPAWECAGLECWIEIGDLGAGEEVSYELAAAVGESVPSDVDEFVNVASAFESLGADLDLSNNADDEVTPLVHEDGVAELYATKVDSFTSPEPYGVPGPVIVYRTEVFNVGTVAAEGVRFSPHGDPATALLPESVIVDGGGRVLIGTGGGVVVEWDEIGAGEMVTVLFSVEIVHPIPLGLRQVACQGFLTGSNIPETPTDDPDTAEPFDPTVTDLEGVIDPQLIDVPTLSGLGLAGLSLLLAAVGLAVVRRRRAAVVRAGLFAALLLAPLRASEAGCGDNSPAVPVPECRSANGAEVDCSSPGAVRLWSGGLRPGLPGKTLPEERDSTDWTSTTIPGANSGHELFQSLAVLEGYLYVAYNAGVQVWDIRGLRAEDPELVAAADGWRGDFFTFPGIGENDFYVDDIGVAEGFTGARLVGVSGKDTAGFTWWLHDAATGALAQLYQDLGNDSRQVRVVSRNGNVFAFTAGPQGLDVYHGSLAELLYTGCPPEVPLELCVCLDDHGSACPGIYLGTLPDELPGLYLDVLFRDQRLFVAASGGTGIPVRIWEVDPMVPAKAELRFSGLSSGAQGLAFFERSGHPYLAAVVREASTPPRWYLRIYDVLDCLTGCSSLPGELFSVEVSSGAVQRFLTYSESGDRPFLYFGLDLIGLEGEGEELLLDLGEFPAAVRELTAASGTYFDTCSGLPVDYWGDYYPGNGNGLRNVRPKVGRFEGKYFYRAAWGILDVHVLEEEFPLFADSFESGDVSGWDRAGE
jgi:uncharacterized repeat protein (TIGR01451 family)